MQQQVVQIGERDITVYSTNTVVVGSGAAGLNAAVCLHQFGQTDIVIVTAGLGQGTSRNTGSDKQTYYKLTVGGSDADSVDDMAHTLFAGGAMDGDVALVEAALSARAFFRLVELGVPFPHNRFGAYVGYKTDHDPRQRATSAGPLTSKFMVERLLDEVKRRQIAILDGHQVVGILKDDANHQAIGLLTLSMTGQGNPSFTLFNCTNTVFATGGPAGIYQRSVYPESQIGATGWALEAGVAAQNLTEWQYGIASLKFRWNLSGTYQQVLPRYISTNVDGTDPQEFLRDSFPSKSDMLDAVFLKGYQWPFDPRKVPNHGSSLIDLLVHQEQTEKGRRVFLDYRTNPTSDQHALDFALLGSEAYTYLEQSDALFGTPYERLAKMNQPAIDLFAEHGIDLGRDRLEIGVCAQHNNGGLQANLWWESNLAHFFPVGEVCGTHGVYRPGGSALNAGQVGAMRAAQYIATRYEEPPLDVDRFLSVTTLQIRQKLDLCDRFLTQGGPSTVTQTRHRIGRIMSEHGAHVRSLPHLEQATHEMGALLQHVVSDTTIAAPDELGTCLDNYQLLVCAYVYLSAMVDYIKQGGRSRGSFLVTTEGADGLEIGEEASGPTDPSHIQETYYDNGQIVFNYRPVRPIPNDSDWFETTWNQFRNDKIIRR